jgi:hypothetical protein
MHILMIEPQVTLSGIPERVPKRNGIKNYIHSAQGQPPARPLA